MTDGADSGRGHRTRTAALTIATVVAIVAPITAFFFAGSRAGDPIDWGSFFRTGAITWFVISSVAVVAVTVWLWLGWDSPDTDSMGDEEVTP